MKTNRFLTTLLFFLLAALLALMPIFGHQPVSAADLHHESITVDTVWATDRGFDSDIVVENGATLTIKSGVTIGVESTGTDPAPYPGGRSGKVEIIVEENAHIRTCACQLRHDTLVPRAFSGIRDISS